MQPSARPVLVGVRSGGDTSRILRFAEELAVSLRTRLEIATVFSPPSCAVPEVLPAQMRHEVDAVAEVFPEVCTELLSSDVRWRLVSAVGRPAVELARMATALDAVILVVGAGTRGKRSWGRRMARSSLPLQLIRICDTPVVVVPLPAARPVPHSALPFDATEA